MSGVGKTRLAKLIGERRWIGTIFLVTIDIGATYLRDEIINNIAQKNESRPVASKPMLENQSISVNSQVTFDNLEPISTFLGKVGNPEEGGLPIDEFIRRQSLFLEAEVKAMYEVPQFINQSQEEGYAHFINDAGGSLCELGDEKLYKLLSEKTLIVYIKTSKETEVKLIDRAKRRPKPFYYNPNFFEKSLQSYLKENNLSYAAQINPDAFVSWVFPKLVADRLKKYESLASKYGCTIKSDELRDCGSAKDVVNLISNALK